MLLSRNEAVSEKWYDRIRLQISAGGDTQAEDRRALVIALTSIKSGDGVTTVALGLAKSFQRASNERVLMILAKESPEQLERLFVGVKPNVIDDAMLLSESIPAEGQMALLPPYVITPEAPRLDPAGAESDPDEATRSHFDTEPRAGNGASSGNGGPAHPDPPVDAIVDRFGGTRPMARILEVPVSTVASWKRRGRIPENRRQIITDLLEQEASGREDESDADVDLLESAEDELLALIGGRFPGNGRSGMSPSAPGGGNLGAQAIIEFFGGVRPMARLAGFPVSTVNSWKRRDNIPRAQIPAILAAARGHEPRHVDERDQWEPTGPSEHYADIEGPEPPKFLNTERPERPGRGIIPAWYPESEFRRRGFILSLGQWGPHVMAIGARGLERSGYGGRWDETFEQLCASYSVIIVDTGSLQSHVPFLWRNDATQMLLVIDSERVTVDDLHEFKRFSGLSKLRPTGTILNNASN